MQQVRLESDMQYIKLQVAEGRVGTGNLSQVAHENKSRPSHTKVRKK